MMFRVELQNGGFTHCGVLEFSAPEGYIFAPQWLMAQLGAQPGDFVIVRSATLPLGSFIRLQPQAPDFLDITDPKAVLEHHLRRFTTLSLGDKIAIWYNERVYELAVKEVQPSAGGLNAINVVETDLRVDFETPVGYVPPSNKLADELLNGIDLNVLQALDLPDNVLLFMPPNQATPKSGPSSLYSGASQTLRQKKK